MKLGIVGLPNVGKSTLFNSLTKAGAESANYPFCTIDPNIGIVAVPDERLKLLGDMYQSKKVTPATIEFVDIAGLVKGASKGEGLGNQFLSNIREVDAIVHVVRCFEDSNIVHVDGAIDPMRDIETIRTAMTAAETGHLVISTLHTIGAANTIDRIIDSFPPNQQAQIRIQLSMVLQAVFSQQLIPRKDMQGVVPALEIMFLNNAIRNMVREAKIHQIDGVIATSADSGMVTMDNSLLRLYREGKITKEHAVMYSSNSELMEKKLGRM